MLSSTLVAWPTSSSQRLIRPSPSLLSCLLGTLLSLSPLPLADSLTNFLFQYSCFPVCKALHRFSFPRLPQGPCSSKGTWERMGIWRKKEHSWGRMGSFQTLFSKSSPQHSPGWKALAGLRDSPTSSHLQKKPSHYQMLVWEMQVQRSWCSGRVGTQQPPSLGRGWGWHIGTEVWYLSPEKPCVVWTLPRKGGRSKD